MPSKLEIMTQVMLSLKSDQQNVMNNINAILNKRDTEEGIVLKVKSYLGQLSTVHAKMQECEAFILQLSASQLKTGTNDEDDNIGSSGDISNIKGPSEK